LLTERGRLSGSYSLFNPAKPVAALACNFFWSLLIALKLTLPGLPWIRGQKPFFVAIPITRSPDPPISRFFLWPILGLME
jgi:hypothetical protein